VIPQQLLIFQERLTGQLVIKQTLIGFVITGCANLMILGEK
jgi:hypothetical protein